MPSGDQTAINGISRRGYTSHSMLGAMGLIHMNGRVQDAVTGRFLSPDPNVPHPGFTQSYNRYAYVNNNPLTYIDPSGFIPCLEGIREVCGPDDSEDLVELDEVFVTGNRVPPYVWGNYDPFNCADWEQPVLFGGVMPGCLPGGETWNANADLYLGDPDTVIGTGIGPGMQVRRTAVERERPAPQEQRVNNRIVNIRILELEPAIPDALLVCGRANNPDAGRNILGGTAFGAATFAVGGAWMLSHAIGVGFAADIGAAGYRVYLGIRSWNAATRTAALFEAADAGGAFSAYGAAAANGALIGGAAGAAAGAIITDPRCGSQP